MTLAPQESQSEAKPKSDTQTTEVPSSATTAPTGNGTSAASGNESATSVSTNNAATSAISTNVPDGFKGSNNGELISYLERKIAENQPLSEADLEKLRRRQKAEGIISGISDAVQSVANLVFTNQYAPNMYNAKEGMSAKAKERFDKEKAEREAADDRWFNYALNLGRLKDAENDRGLRIWQTEQNMLRQDRAYDQGERHWQAGFDRQGEWREEDKDAREKQAAEEARRFDISNKNEQQRIGLEARRLAKAEREGRMTFNLGSGNGNVTLSLDRLNAQTVSRIYNTLPQNVRSQVQGAPIVQNGFVIGHKEPTTEDMLIAIGANVENSPATQSAIRQVAGLETGKKPKLY